MLTAYLSGGFSPNERAYGPTTTSNPRTIAEIRAEISALPTAHLGAAHCQHKSDGQVLTLFFIRHAGDKPVESVVAEPSGCETVDIYMHGHLVQPVLSGVGFAARIEKQLGWKAT
jgi:hypothetical protein